MGVIQGAINQTLGAVAGGAAAVKHFNTQAKQLEAAERGELASLTTAIPETESDINKLTQKETELDTDIVSKVEDFREEQESGTLKREDFDPVTGKYNQEREIEKEHQALLVVQGQLKAKKMQMDLYKNRFNELSKKYGGNK